MIKDIKEILISGVFIFIIGFIIWPPYDRYNYWAWLSDGFIGSIILVPILILSIISGAIFKIVADTQLFNFIVSSIIAYIIGMYMIETVWEPISPAHFILYGSIVAGFVIGVAISDHLPLSIFHLQRQ